MTKSLFYDSLRIVPRLKCEFYNISSINTFVCIYKFDSVLSALLFAIHPKNQVIFSSYVISFLF